MRRKSQRSPVRRSRPDRPGGGSGGPPLILFLSPEAVPFAKTGGLADVAGALPVALKALGADVRLMLPFYREVREKNLETRPLKIPLSVPVGGRTLSARVLETSLGDDIPVYLLDREDLYDRPNLYGSGETAYYDNLERYTFFTRGALMLAGALSLRPDIIHCHDWQTGLIPALLRGPHKGDPALGSPATVFTIHNLRHKGLFPGLDLPVTGLPGPLFFHMEGIEYWGNLSLLKAGIVYSSAVTTVSPGYAREIMTPEYGEGMEGILLKRKADLHGILNGADYRVWNPRTDPLLPVNYDPGRMGGKARCKTALIRKAGLDPALEKRPLMGMVTRIDNQKGLDLVLAILKDLPLLEAGLVILGTGDSALEEALRKGEKDHPGRMRVFITYDEALAHLIYAGADLFLVPSRYEPCGLTQLYALKYGTVPVVRATGGLDDTVEHYDPRTRKGTGFKFGPYEGKALFSALREAVDLFGKGDHWKGITAGGMEADFSWDRSARKYLDLYRSLLKGG